MKSITLQGHNKTLHLTEGKTYKNLSYNYYCEMSRKGDGENMRKFFDNRYLKIVKICYDDSDEVELVFDYALKVSSGGNHGIIGCWSYSKKFLLKVLDYGNSKKFAI